MWHDGMELYLDNLYSLSQQEGRGCLAINEIENEQYLYGQNNYLMLAHTTSTHNRTCAHFQLSSLGLCYLHFTLIILIMSPFQVSPNARVSFLM